VRDYIVSYRARATDLVTSQLGRLEPLRRSLLTAYQTTLSTAAPETGAQELGTPAATREATPRRVVTGPGAVFLNELRSGAERLRAMAEAASLIVHTRILNAGQTRLSGVRKAVGQSIRAGGYSCIKSSKNGSNWTVRKCHLGRLGLQAERTIDALQR
jgi:hypothetical protein